MKKTRRRKNLRSKKVSKMRKRTYQGKKGGKRKDFHCYIYDILKISLKKGYTINNIFDFYICMYRIKRDLIIIDNSKEKFFLVNSLLDLYFNFMKSLTSKDKQIILKDSSDHTFFPKDLYDILQISNIKTLNSEDLIDKLIKHKYLLKKLNISNNVRTFMLYLGILNKKNKIQSDNNRFFKKGYVSYCGIRGFFRTNKNRKKKHEEILNNFIIPDFEESIIKDSLESLKNDQGFLHPRPKYNLLNDPTAPLYYDYFFKKNHIKEYKNIKSLLDTIFSYQKKLKLEDNEGSWVG
tara:strand:+ start:1943 stop:2821 length:879 start_codon:yes stop_codon:yes gene_type:complete